MDTDNFMGKVPKSARVVKNVSAMNGSNSPWLGYAGNFCYKKLVLLKKLFFVLAV